VIEQQAYFCERAGQIDWMRIMCSGPEPHDRSTHQQPGRLGG
jgi:hypothetical protein